MIRCIHFADYHLGVDSSGPKNPTTNINGRVLDYLDTLDALIEYAIDNKCDVVLFAGDAFHKAHPDMVYMREFAERIVRLREVCDVVLLVGNHDLPGHAHKLSSLELYETMQVDGVIVGNDYEVIEIAVRDEVLSVATVPYPARGRLVDAKEMRGLSADDRGALVGDKLAEIIEGLRGECAPGPAVLLGHFTVSTAMYGPERIVEVTSAEPVVPLVSLLEPEWDYVALGHLHLHQNLGGDKPVVYAGSMERVDFGEEKQPKGFVWIEFDNGNTTWEFVEVDARPYRSVKIDLTGVDEKHMRHVMSHINKVDWQDAVAKVTITIHDNHVNHIRKTAIHNAIMQAGAYYIFSISLNVIQDTRDSRLGGGKPIQQWSEDELLETYFTSVGITDRNEVDDLIDLAFEIMDEVDNG